MQWWQILLLTLYSAYQICDELTIVSSAGSPVFAGFITGLIMGNMEVGLLIGASLQLVVLGVGTFGGASRIDATSGAVLATAFSISQGLDPEIAISTIGVPVAGLLVYTDILGRFTTTFFAHRVDAAIERFDYAGIERNYLLGAIPWALSRALPVFLALTFGGGLVDTLVTTIELPEYKWIAAGLTLAARMLPGLGFAILLHYLPLKRNLHYLAFGFALTAMLTVLYGNVSALGGAVAGIVGTLPEDAGVSFVNNFKGLSMIGIAIVGAFLSVLHYINSQKVAVVAPSNSESGEIDDDEI